MSSNSAHLLGCRRLNITCFAIPVRQFHVINTFICHICSMDRLCLFNSICWRVVIAFRELQYHLGEISYYLPYIIAVWACCNIPPKSWPEIVIKVIQLLKYLLIVFATIFKSLNLFENWFSQFNAEFLNVLCYSVRWTWRRIA